ncbi:Zn-ribbon domain-containing OB-fold protein [Mycobacteroides abscessus]|uniref:Zn-ribbon domain-containing OB-fold protein n=1 Tax=Mycobacteroides abscessus TaxID=36809 RepID=UPI003AF732C6
MISGPPIVRDERSEQFFDSAANNQLVIKRCCSCSHWLGIEAHTCSICGSLDLKWCSASGVGKLITWSIVHSIQHPAFANQLPFPIGYVELAEGPWISTRIVNVGRDELRTGLPLLAHFIHPGPGMGESYPVFGPASREHDAFAMSRN